VSQHSSDNTIDINLSGATDTVSGVDGYSVAWSNSPTTLPDNIKDMEETSNTTTSPPLADGTWYFHLRTVDNAGNWTSTVHLGPFIIDTVSPTTSLNSNPATPNGTNGWFKTTPSITLTSNEAGTTYYQWDSTSTSGWTTYLSSFNAPEGTHTLYYYSVDSANNTETVKSQVFKVDRFLLFQVQPLAQLELIFLGLAHLML
jgi:hypothetical protein